MCLSSLIANKTNSHLNFMGLRAKKPCNKPRCKKFTIPDSAYCEDHTQEAPRKNYKRYDRNRGSSHERGYGAAWRKLRLFIIARDPFCVIGEICDPADIVTGKRSGRRAPSTDVDHIVPKEAGGTDEDTNLQGACHACHSWKTATQDSTFAKKKIQ